MTLTIRSETPAPDGPTDDPSLSSAKRRLRAMSVWTVAFAAWWLFLGLPLTDPILTFGWLWAATIAWRIDRPWRVHLRFARDWVMVVLLLQVYNLSRGFADQGVVPHAMEMVVADRGMFGWLTGGQVPTLWLQEHLFDPDGIHWWDVFASWVYFSHFVATPTVAVVLWLRDRARWMAWVLRWILLSAAGLATYFLYPAAPPWWAGRYGLIDPVSRGSTRAWDAIGLHGAGNVINAGQYSSNPVAAMPSLHTAFALLVVVFFMPRVRRRWWPLLLAYPLAMTFTLVYSGEHYMIDVFMGWLYVGLVCLVAALIERWWGPFRRARAERLAAVSAADGRALATAGVLAAEGADTAKPAAAAGSRTEPVGSAGSRTEPVGSAGSRTERTATGPDTDGRLLTTGAQPREENP